MLPEFPMVTPNTPRQPERRVRVPRMVLDDPKELFQRLDGAEGLGLDSLGFGLVWNDP